LFIGALLFFMPMLSFATAAPPGPDEIVLSLADDGRQAELGEGQVLVIALEANPSTGYSWQVAELDETILRLVDVQFESTPGRIGAPTQQVLRFAGVRAGETSPQLVYRRPWESDVAPLRIFSLQVKTVGLFAQVNIPAVPPAPPETVDDSALVSAPSVLALPSAFNWCDQGGCTAIKNQASCGSCWAFATVGVLEASIKIHDGLTKDLAEQYLVSCASEYNGCGGGWFAHDYHEWKIPAGELAAGAVYESDFPYQAKDSSKGVSCNYTLQPHTHHEKIASWTGVDPYHSVPPVSAIKQAIYDHGPVAAAVCVGSEFQRYRNGIFQKNETCSGEVNHAVVLVGWDDSKQAWRLRNSWGTGWGESGYMWIKWGTSLVGFEANYIVYNGTPTAPAAPINLTAQGITQDWINLSWMDNSGNESGFKIERSLNGTSGWTQIATVGANANLYANTGLTLTTFYYRARAYNAVGDSGYSNTASAAPAAGVTTKRNYLPLVLKSAEF
jgi:inhibitor of cysteine peptidase